MERNDKEWNLLFSLCMPVGDNQQYARSLPQQRPLLGAELDSEQTLDDFLDIGDWKILQRLLALGYIAYGPVQGTNEGTISITDEGAKALGYEGLLDEF